MKVTVKVEPPPPPAEHTVTITMSLSQAKIIRTIFNNTNETSLKALDLYTVWKTLADEGVDFDYSLEGHWELRKGYL